MLSLSWPFDMTCMAIVLVQEEPHCDKCFCNAVLLDLIFMLHQYLVQQTALELFMTRSHTQPLLPKQNPVLPPLDTSGSGSEKKLWSFPKAFSWLKGIRSGQSPEKSEKSLGGTRINKIFDLDTSQLIALISILRVWATWVNSSRCWRYQGLSASRASLTSSLLKFFLGLEDRKE